MSNVHLVKFPSFLRVLNVAGNQIAGINERKFLASAVNLQTLDMSDNNIEDITPRNVFFRNLSDVFERLMVRCPLFSSQVRYHSAGPVPCERFGVRRVQPGLKNLAA